MPPRKTINLYGSFLNYRLAAIELRMRKLLLASQEPEPPNLRHAIGLLVLCRDAPDLFYDSDACGERLRLELVQFLTKYPKHAIACLRAVHSKPDAGDTATAAAREFLLTKFTIGTHSGKSQTVNKATDKEIAFAAENWFRATTGRPINISEKVVTDERKRLERKFGEPISEFANFLATLANTIAPDTYPPRRRNRLRQEILKSFYTEY